MISLGCAKNLVDAEIMLGSLMKDGVEITNDPAHADAVIVNTCSFIDSAQEESVDTILESVELRDASRRGQAVIVSGCLSQRFREELPKLMPEVDAFMGIDQVAQVGNIVGQAVAARAEKIASRPKSTARAAKAKISARLGELEKNRDLSEHEANESIRNTGKFGKTKVMVAAEPAEASGPVFDVTARPVFIPDFGTPRFRLTPGHFAYLKIAEGCNHPCSFCIIPRMRGSHRSRSQSDIIAEARALIADGVKEINLISQDSTYYGLDLRPNHSRAISSPEKFSAATRSLSADATTICTLLRELNSLKGDFWIRLLYTHPAHWTDELVQTIADCPKVARYVDMPLQHISDRMLTAMQRETSGDTIRNLVRRIRAGIPGIALRTTFIVGFPGETEEDVDELCAFIREARFERLGVFRYSQEEGTRAAKMGAQVPSKEKERRWHRVMALQRDIASSVSSATVGRTLKVLVDEVGVARGEADAPDIDGRVYVPRELTVGSFAEVTINGHHDYDLLALPAGASPAEYKVAKQAQ